MRRVMDEKVNAEIDDLCKQAHMAAEKRLTELVGKPDFDGCARCASRETLIAAWPYIMQPFRVMEKYQVIAHAIDPSEVRH